MKKIIAFLITIVATFFHWGQELSSSIEVIVAPYCRSSGAQTGNGILYALIDGGSPPYDYTWYDSIMNPFINNTNTTVNIKGPGKYFLNVTDANNNSIIDSITVLDSINPISNFEINSADLYSLIPLQTFDGTKINLINTSPGIDNFFPPIISKDTTYIWTISSILGDNQYICTPKNTKEIDISIDEIGMHEICLIRRNNNNCRDTLCKEIALLSPLILNTEIPVAVFPNYNSKIVSFHSKDFSESHILSVYSCSGQLIERTKMYSSIQTIEFYQSSALYIYAITLNNDIVASGKFTF